MQKYHYHVHEADSVDALNQIIRTEEDAGWVVLNTWSCISSSYEYTDRDGDKCYSHTIQHFCTMVKERPIEKFSPYGGGG